MHSCVFKGPFVSFFFARLCHLPSLGDRARPKVGPFVRGDWSYKSVLLFFYPLVHHSVGITETLGMSVLDESIHSSELKASFSSGDESEA